MVVRRPLVACQSPQQGNTVLFGNMDWRACLQSLVQDTQHNLAAIPPHGSYPTWSAKKVGAGTPSARPSKMISRAERPWHAADN
jgi:hypothetical protein